MQPIQGIHHITAIAGDPQKNINFYLVTRQFEGIGQ
jgi:catechol 2,3-dioxygenase-like lactoylglutathione lyase family enzyme